MKRKRKKKKYIYIIITGLFTIIILFSLLNDNDKFIYSFKSISASIVNVKSDKKLSNKVLESEINDLKKEIEDLKEFVNIDKTLSDKVVVNAVVIKRSPNYWYDIITINKGKKDKVKKGNAVMSATGLIGIVSVVNNNTSEVRLITGLSNNYISAKVSDKNKEYFGLIKKYDYKNNELYLENVVGDLENKKEGKIVTSGLSNNMPSGLLIGEVKEIKKDKYNLSNTITITPSADFNNIKLVRVIESD